MRREAQQLALLPDEDTDALDQVEALLDKMGWVPDVTRQGRWLLPQTIWRVRLTYARTSLYSVSAGEAQRRQTIPTRHLMVIRDALEKAALWSHVWTYR